MILCELLVGNYADAYWCVSTDGTRVRSNWKTKKIVISPNNIVAAAAAVCNLQTFRLLVRDKRSILWDRSAAFGYPLDAAAYTNNLDIVKALVEQAIVDWKSSESWMQALNRHSFTMAILKAIERRHIQVLSYLLARYRIIFGKVSEYCMKIWFPIAFQSRNV
jgi:hypothetical protein